MSGRKVQRESARSRLARNLRAIRTSQGISQEELGDLAQLHRTYIGFLERLERNPSLENIERLADALDVDIVDLLAVTR
jgi:transcriptional regulator with XRE-family HTH domain